MTVRVFTFVYGKHLDLWRRTITCLGWPKNKEALKDAVWSVYTDDIDAAKRVVPDAEVTKIKISSDIGKQLSDCLIRELKACYQRRASMLLAPPDTIFGDGTIQNLITLGSESSAAISVPHPRVVLETFPELDDPLSNAQLVTLAFQHMHEVWKLSDVRLEKNNAYSSGTAWRELVPGMYAVTMRIPTPYFIRPIARDIEPLENSGSGGWDHRWPQSLVKEGRHRLVGSSDAAFMVELTPLNIPQGKLYDRNKDEPDHYSGLLQHHLVNRNTVAIWRADVASAEQG